MQIRLCLFGVLAVGAFAQTAPMAMERPKAGPVQTMRSADVKPGMKAIAWTVFSGSVPEPVPIEIIGTLKNYWGPKQDTILCKMGGKAERTFVAGGMSGSPVYIDGKLIGAVALRVGQFTADPICGITPIDLMLEINDFDTVRMSAPLRRAEQAIPDGSAPVGSGATLVPIDTPLVFTGFSQRVLDLFGSKFRESGATPVQGGAASLIDASKPVAGWQDALRPGDTVAGLLVSGDMSVTGMGTVTYNDGKRVLAFGHSFLNFGAVNFPMAKGEIVTTLASNYSPTKMGNATEVVGAFKQDRHSGIMGMLGEQAPMIPSRVKVRTLDSDGKVVKEKESKFQVFSDERYTPYLTLVTLYNSLATLNDYNDEATYQISGRMEFADNKPIILSNIFARPDGSASDPSITAASWWADKVNKLYLNNVKLPNLTSFDVTVDVAPERRTASIYNAFTEKSEVEAGGEVPVRIFLRTFRGAQMERTINVKIPSGFARGEHRILLSDSDTLNRTLNIAAVSSRYIDLPEAVSLINQERTNNRLYVSLVESRPTIYNEDRSMPSLPGSFANVMQMGRAANRNLVTAPETVSEITSIPLDVLVTGSFALRIKVN
jgi:hypothetical protein